ncbi:MAG: hypothetical protein QNK20_16745 [Aureibaculum sp.]|nr:hypothetical protein [Aureibaculum sp.]
MKVQPIKLRDDLGNDLLKDYNLNSLMNDLTKKMVNNFSAKREELIKDRLEDLGIIFDYKEEEKRVFKRFASVRNGNEETILFNDGSIKGLRVITFVDKLPDFDFESLRMSYTQSYY